MLSQITSLYSSVKAIVLPLLNKFFLAAILLLVGIIIGRVVSTLIQKFLHSAELNKLVSQGAHSKVPIEEIIAYTIRYVLYFLFFVLALNTIGFTSIIITVFAIIVFLIFILSVFLGIKDFIPNAIAGLMIRRKGFIKVNDKIESNGISGKILRINLLDTQIETFSGDIISLPNVLLSQKEIKKKQQKNSKKKTLTDKN